MEKCFGCKKRIWPWQAQTFPNAWHRSCFDLWESGYRTASKIYSLGISTVSYDYKHSTVPRSFSDIHLEVKDMTSPSPSEETHDC